MSSDALALKEKALKERIQSGQSLRLRLIWDRTTQAFYLKAVGESECFDILTWKGAPKTFKDPVLAIGWAEDFGFSGVLFEDIDFS
jgi:hypothetical protein